jgi:hypothetical protein
MRPELTRRRYKAWLLAEGAPREKGTRGEPRCGDKQQRRNLVRLGDDEEQSAAVELIGESIGAWRE